MLNPIYEEIFTSQRKKLGTEQSTVEAKLGLEEDKQIVKVLMINALPYISESEIKDGEIKFTGQVKFSAIVEDGEGKVFGIDKLENFTTSFQNYNEKNSTIQSKCNLMDISVSVEGGMAQVSACLEIDIVEISSVANKYLSSVEGDAFVENSNLSVTKLKASINQSFNSVTEVEVKEVPSRVISCSLTALCDSSFTANNYVTATGILQYNICYEFQKEETFEFKTVSGVSNFKYEIDCDGVAVKDMSRIVANINPSTINCEIAVENKENILRLTGDVNLSGEVYSDTETAVVTDLFSCSNKLQLSYSSIEFTSLLDTKTFEDKVNGVIAIDENSPRVEKILCTENNNVFVTKSIIENEKLIVEGIAYVSVVYLNSEDALSGGMQFEIPFTTSLKLDEEMCATTPCVNCCLINVSARARRGREIEIDADVKINAVFFKQNTDAVISELQVSEEKLVNENSLSIYIAKQDDSVWKIAKKMKINPEQLLQQNPSLQNGLAKGDKIVVYRKR